MIAALLLIAALGPTATAEGSDVSYVDASVELAGELLSMAFIDVDQDGQEELCLALRMETGERELRKLMDQFGPDVYCDFLIDFMRQHREDPMMLYFPMALTHGPLVHTPAEPDVKDKRSKFEASCRSATV